MMKLAVPLLGARYAARPALVLALALGALLTAGSAQAQLRNVDLGFRPPADTRVVGFHVYIASASHGYADYRDNINFIPPVDAGGLAHFPLTGLEQFSDVYLSLKSYDAQGAESPFSNEIVVAAQENCLVTGCNDNNSCTTDTCTSTGCKFDPAPNKGNTCDDGSTMTFNDMCQTNGSCGGTIAQCNADSDCGAPADLCAGPQVCVAHMCQAGTTPRADNTTCNDGNASTPFDACRGGVCRGFACGNDAQCSDGQACNGAERCVNNACVAGTPMVCNDNNSCTTDTCSGSTCKFDPASHVGNTCDDGNGMTFNDMCRTNGSCGGTVAQCNVDTDCGAPADLCAGPQACVAHTCQAGTTPRADNTTCNDGNSSTPFDVCRSGVCRGLACGNDSQCSDGQACNGAERCVNNACVAGTPMVCSDGNQCNGTETCVGSACVAGTAMQCPADDGPCFDAFCDPAQGCRVQIHPDGEMCSTAMSGASGQCASGVCVATPPTQDPNAPTHAPRPPMTNPNASCGTVYGAATDLRQELSDNSETSRKIVWHAPLNPMGSLLQYRLDSENTWRSLRAVPQAQMGCMADYSVTLGGLQSAARYHYRVSGAALNTRTWTNGYALTPGPANPRGKFKFAFFAANGLAASRQSPQAGLVLDQVKKGHFPLVLGGGGYALSTEAIAAGAATNAAQAIALWKEQASAVTANSIFAPVLGDTEVASFAHAETASDYAEYMLLAGSPQTPYDSYSYDFGGTHFLAVNAPTLGSIHPSTAAGAAHLAWIDADLAAARTNGARWIVVYMHSDLFSSDKTDASVQTVRTALGTILMRRGVNLVLSGEGDSYERTKALRGNTLTAGPVLDPAMVTTATDGVVFVRSGSGGRTAFTPWMRPAQPVWSAFRDNTHATYVQVTVSDKQLMVTTYGLDDAGRRTVLDTLKIY
jgi:hypothetical protein